MRTFYAKVVGKTRYNEHKVIAENHTDALIKIMKHYGGSKPNLKFIIKPFSQEVLDEKGINWFY